MNERDGVRLMSYADGTLPPAEREAVEAWISVDSEARRLLAEHRALWRLLGEAEAAASPAPSAEFRQRTLQRANEPAAAAWKPRVVALLAASVLISVIVFAWQDAASRSALGAEDVVVVGNLDLLESLAFMDEHAAVLDEAVLASVLHEFSAEPGTRPAPDAAGDGR